MASPCEGTSSNSQGRLLWHDLLQMVVNIKNVTAMPACTFSIPFSGSATDLLNRAQAAIHEQGGHFRSDETSGFFELTVLGSEIKGSFDISGQELNVTIDSKPFMIPCSTIQHYLGKQLETVNV